MGKQRGEQDRLPLPEGCRWANWSKAPEVKAEWDNVNPEVRAKLRGVLSRIRIATLAGERLPKNVVEWDDGVNKAKRQEPNPGWRAWFFRDGDTFFVTHFYDKGHDNHDKQKRVALKAKSEHLENKARNQKRKQSNTHRRSRKRQ